MNILEEIQNCPVEWKDLGEVVFLKRGKQLPLKQLLMDLIQLFLEVRSLHTSMETLTEKVKQ